VSGYDGSPQSEKAVAVALSLAAPLDAHLLVLAVARPPEPATSVELHAVLDDAKEHFEAGFQKIRAQAAERQVDLETEVLVGHPAEQIIHRAGTAHADLVILGHRGTSGFQRWMMGSVSDKVTRYAHCPVLIVR
jgi:nucleotide-binding universal stress UspA family protein